MGEEVKVVILESVLKKRNEDWELQTCFVIFAFIRGFNAMHPSTRKILQLLRPRQVIARLASTSSSEG